MRLTTSVVLDTEIATMIGYPYDFGWPQNTNTPPQSAGEPEVAFWKYHHMHQNLNFQTLVNW